MNQYLKVNCVVDIVMCIDLTGGMQPCIETIKKNVQTFWPQLRERLAMECKHVEKVRVKVIGFRDFEADGDKALVQSKFFEVSNDVLGEDKEFEDFVKGLYADGGGDEPENALEALDTSNPYYPADMPHTFDELENLWNEHKAASKRMIIFAPETYPWLQICAEWEQIVYWPSADSGLADAVTDENIFALLVNFI